VRPESPAFALIGRQAELRRVDRLLQDMLSGRGALLLLSGESGIGKTALATVIRQRAQARGATVAVGRCYETAGMPAFAPWQDLLADLQAAGVALEELPPPFGHAPISLTAYELLQAVTRGLLGVAREHALVLCMEDVHWADRDTL
jgi:predicted ATPase